MVVVVVVVVVVSTKSCHQLRAPPWAKGEPVTGRHTTALPSPRDPPPAGTSPSGSGPESPEKSPSLAGLVLWHAPLTAGLVVRPFNGFSKRTSAGT